MLTDYIGKRFGKLVVLRVATEQDCHISTVKKFVCKCDCGKISYPSVYSIRDGKAKSCGCGIREATIKRSTKHGRAARGKSTRLYHIWSNMKERCQNSRHPRFHQYGGKGVTVCQEWQDFLSFEKWSLENGYSDNLTIDRIDSSKGYNPSNCRWITLEENSSLAHKKDFEEAAKQELLNGASTREIADKYKIHISTAIRWAYAAGLSKPKKGARIWQLNFPSAR